MRAAAVVVCLSVVCATATYGRETLPGWFDLPVTGGAATLAAFGIPDEERAFTLSLIARAFDDRDISDLPALAAGDPIAVPAPLSADAWRRLLAVPRDEDLFARIIADRPALLLASALTATDESVRALVLADRDLLEFLHREGTGGFVLAARSLRVADGRIVVPGGDGAERIWELLTGVSPARPAPFLRALVSKDKGRLAWYFDSMAQLDGARVAAAWPAESNAARLEAAQALYAAFRDADGQMDLAIFPYRRTVADAWTVLSTTELSGSTLAGPSWLPFWQVLFANDNPTRAQFERLGRDPLPQATLGWLTREVVSKVARERRDRFEMFRLAQRVFAAAPPSAMPDLGVALSGYRRYRALLLTLERIGITAPSTWAAAVDAARYVDAQQGDDRDALASFQGALALVERLRHVRTIDETRSAVLIRALSDAIRGDRRIVSGVIAWITTSLVPALPPLERPDAWTSATAFESTILQALWGPSPRQPRLVEWEGLTYRIDRAEAERERLRALRTLLPSPGLDAAIASGDRRAFAEALIALLYATALGDPDGPAALSRDVSRRHDFGLRATAIVREQRPWAPAEERQGLGPWHVQGALLGLDLGLSRLALRRVADGQMPRKPVLTLNDLGTLTRTVVAMVPDALADADRDEIAAALQRGRRRVAEAAADLGALQQLAHEARISPTARQLLPWMMTRQPGAVTAVFSLRDLLWLGRPRLDAAQLAPWGVSGDGIDGRRITMFPEPAPWENFAGRSDVGQTATQVPDLTLRLVEETARLKLPAELIPALLAFAVDDYFHEAQTRFADDWPRMARQAAALEPTRVEDYVAALTGGGPLRAQ